MRVHHGAAGFFLIALVLNLGWLWIPLGVAALLIASMGFLRVTKEHWHPGVSVSVLGVAWVPYVLLVLGSGLTIGAAGRELVSLGGFGFSGAFEQGLRAFTGAIVPALVAVGLVQVKAPFPRLLAKGALATGLVLVPLALWAGSTMGGIPEDADPMTATNPVGPVAAALVVVPFVLAYGLCMMSALAAWRGWEAVPRRLRFLSKGEGS